MMAKHNAIEKKAVLETDRYIYHNPVTRWLTNRGHKTCAQLRCFDSPGSLVVDLGCGKGTHFSYVTLADALGIDVLSEMLAKARENILNRSLLGQGDIFSLPLKDNQVDSIISFGVLEHLSPLRKALLEIYRVLRNGGEFIFGIPCEGFLYRLGREFTTKRHVERATGVDYNRLLAREHVNQCRDILKQLEEFFVIQRPVGIPFLIPNINLNAFLVARCVKKVGQVY